MFDRRRAREQNNLIRLLSRAGPDFLTVDDVASPVRDACVLILDVSRPASGSVTPKQARHEPSMMEGNHSPRCAIRPVLHNRMQTEDVDVHGRTGGESAGAAPDLLHHDCGFGDAYAGAAELPRASRCQANRRPPQHLRTREETRVTDLFRPNSRRRICRIARVSRFGFRVALVYSPTLRMISTYAPDVG